ncbi:CatB-related O-acetyltransferase [Clostridium sp. YIM B02515]|uniref:CatB-related O-acetyltransferase n=1 Tax=Clostridium rhizosphaerae TaxID=2803861 RepID=A0ABS1TDA8_9CLOT|nr:CatB-related O-acetyltransferase [Clostridium rhizosphaerae]MBL4936334.1 CatB-related O-acetyltransferase [Clostridium rhizosphaerae]
MLGNLIRTLYINTFMKVKLKKNNNTSLSYLSKDVVLEDYIVIGAECKISNGVFIGRGTAIGENAFINHCKIIGRFCSIARNVSIGIGNHPKQFLSTSPIFYSKSRGLVNVDSYDYRKEDLPAIIGNDVWIGENVLIMNGVKVGNGAIIGAGSVVTKDVVDYSIVGGVPAKIIKMRFNEDVMKKLINSRWWEKDLDVLSKLEFTSNIEDVINQL